MFSIVRWDAKSIFLKRIGCHLHHCKIQCNIGQQGIFCNGGDGTQSFSRRWIWHPISLYDTLLYSIHVYCPIIYCAMVEMAPNPFQETGFGIPSHYMIEYLDTQLTDNILYPVVLYCSTFCNGGDGTQSFSRRWTWHPSSLYDIILYSIDV